MAGVVVAGPPRPTEPLADGIREFLGLVENYANVAASGAGPEYAAGPAGGYRSGLFIDIVPHGAELGSRLLRREIPIIHSLGEGRLVEGVVDLAFLRNGEWTVVDFKTDREVEAELDRYVRQVRLYSEAIGAATGVPVRGVLLVI